MEDQETLVRQGGAELLLDSEAFSSTINALVDASFQTFSNTAPSRREGSGLPLIPCPAGYRLDTTPARVSQRRNQRPGSG